MFLVNKKYKFYEIITKETIIKDNFTLFQQMDITLYQLDEKNSSKVIGIVEIPLETINLIKENDNKGYDYINLRQYVKHYSVINNKNHEEIAILKCCIYLVKLGE